MKILNFAAAGACAALLAAPAAATMPEATLLTVTASGKSTRAPDIATISAGVMTQAAEAADAMRQNAARMSRVIAALKRAGVAARDIQTSHINLNPQYHHRNNQAPIITGYQASNTVNVKFRKLDNAGNVLDALVKQGANQINGPSFGLDKPAAALDAARVKAVGNARKRAALYAGAAGMRVKRIVSINEGHSAPRPYPMYKGRMEMAEMADAATPVQPGELDMSANVTVIFELE